MRQWEAGDPIEGGNDTGIPDTKYFDYLKGGSDDDDYIPSRDDSSYFDDSYERRYEALVLKARELSGQGMYGEAVKYYEAALEIISYDRKLLAEMAECYLKSGNASKAGKCYYELGSGIKYRDNEKALEYFKKAFEIDSSNPSYGFCLGTILEDMGRYREAIGYLKKAEANWHVANCHMELKEYSEAISYLDKCIDENHLRDDFAEQKFECLMHQGTAKAIDFYFERCDALMKMGYYFEAVRYLDRILEVQSSNSRAAGLRKSTYQTQGLQGFTASLMRHGGLNAIRLPLTVRTSSPSWMTFPDAPVKA
jgi:tetratricopeptide (TPR) repeat protein